MKPDLEFREGNLSLEIVNTHFCSTCKTETTIPALNISVKGYEGDYCMTCWAKFIVENVPILRPLKEKR